MARVESVVFGPGVVLGAGLGGMLDGIVLHQLLGWHHLLSARTGDMRANEIADGLFHAAAWVAVAAGLLWLYARVRLPPVPAAWPRPARGPRAWRALLGPMLIGWGLFNFVEGLVDHQLLGLHHVRMGGNELAWDLAYLASGVLLAAAGYLLSRRQPAPE